MRDDVTKLLTEVREGSEQAYHKLFSAVYGKLEDIAHQQLRFESNDHTFSTRDLVHELFLRMADKKDVIWENRSHFYGVVSICMKQLLVDHARKKLAQKRGGGYKHETYIDELVPGEKDAQKIINLDQALEQLKELDERMAQVVEHRYFGGLTIEQTADVLDVSKNTVKRDWKKARGFLYKIAKKDLI
mgnify:CR=1 FL=1|jgi:RNA polymerase sigma factor (TIGR02999 family)